MAAAAHKKRFTLDVYTNDASMTQQEFAELVAHYVVDTEIELNKDMLLRWHINEAPVPRDV